MQAVMFKDDPIRYRAHAQRRMLQGIAAIARVVPSDWVILDDAILKHCSTEFWPRFKNASHAHSTQL